MKAILLILLLSTLAFGQTSLRVGDTAPTFSMNTIDGNLINLEDNKGKVVVLTFWSTRCEICRSEIPRLNQIVRQYESKNVIFVAATTENESRLTPFLKANKFDFQVLPDSFGMILKYADRDRSGNLDMGYPAFFVIDKSGKIGFRASGYDKTTQIAANLDRLLDQ